MHNPLPAIINSLRNGSKYDFIYLVTTCCVGIMYYRVYGHNRSAVGTNPQGSCESLKKSEASAAPVQDLRSQLKQHSVKSPWCPFPFQWRSLN